MKFRTLLAFFLVFTALGATAQSKLTADDLTYLLEASRVVDPERYPNVRGTPYRYADFDTIVVYDPAINAYVLDRANYNGFSNQIEFYTADGQLRELAQRNFLRAEVPQAEGKPHVYVFGLNPKFRDRYVQLLHRGDFVTATMVYDVKNDEKITQTVGKTLKFQRFNPKSLHFAIVDGDFLTLKLTSKQLAEDLGFKNELTKFIKANKLKPGQTEDLVRIYAEAERLWAEQ